MAEYYKKIYNGLVNPVYMNGTEIDVYDKKITLNRISITSWNTVHAGGYSARNGPKLVYHGLIHIFGEYGTTTSNDGYRHRTFNGETLSILPDTPSPVSGAAAVVFNDELHVLGGGTTKATKMNHMKWNDTDKTWITLDTKLPYQFYNGSAIVANGELHILGGSGTKNHYIFDGTSWKKGTALPQVLYGNQKTFITECTYNYDDSFTEANFGRDLIHFIWVNKNGETCNYVLIRTINNKGKITESWTLRDTLSVRFDKALVMDKQIYLYGDLNTGGSGSVGYEYICDDYGAGNLSNPVKVSNLPEGLISNDNAEAMLSYGGDIYLLYDYIWNNDDIYSKELLYSLSME